MTLDTIIKQFFKDDTIFIEGGYGESFEDRIIIYKSIENDFIGDEYKILEYMRVIKGAYAYWMIQQSLRRIENSTLDILEVDFYSKDMFEKESVKRVEIFFDITQCFGKE